MIQDNTQQQNNKLHFRPMTVHDLPTVKDIENRSFTVPWTMQMYLDDLLKNNTAHYIVASLQNKVVGYCGSLVLFDEGHITTIAIDPNYRGKGFGDELLKNKLDFIKSKGAKHVFLEVRESNTSAQKLYRKYGFLIIGHRAGYYMDNQETAVVMKVNFNDSTQ